MKAVCMTVLLAVLALGCAGCGTLNVTEAHPVPPQTGVEFRTADAEGLATRVELDLSTITFQSEAAEVQASSIMPNKIEGWLLYGMEPVDVTGTPAPTNAPGTNATIKIRTMSAPVDGNTVRSINTIGVQ
jgi:hypothetical protein